MSQYSKENVADKNEDDNIDELALASSSDLECYNCKGRGHKARNCPHPRKISTYKNNKQKKSKGACWTSDMKGHKQEDCWYLDKNKDKRPANWKPKKEIKAANIEIAFCGVCDENIDEIALTSVDMNEYDSVDDEDSTMPQHYSNTIATEKMII